MATKNKIFKAQLIKYCDNTMKEPIWFWVNPNTGKNLSSNFSSQQDAEEWFDSVIRIHEETTDLMERISYGTFYTVRGKVDIGDLISSKKGNECPFTMHLYDDILELEVLAVSEEHARKRVEEFFEILEWMD